MSLSSFFASHLSQRSRLQREKYVGKRRLLAEQLEDRRLLVSPGSFDLTYGAAGDGTASSVVSIEDQARAIAIQADGKAIVGGSTQLAANGRRVFAYSRLTDAGVVDETFANSGSGTIDFGPNTFGVDDLAIAPDQKIVMTGTRNSAGFGEVLIARVNADGQLDSTFSTDGRLVLPLTESFFPTSLTVASDSKILITGFFPRQNTEHLAAVVRLNPNGEIDLTFGDNGVVSYESPRLSSFYDVAVQADGRIVVVGTDVSALGGTSTWDTLAIRLLPNGEYDPTFGNQGVAIIDISGDYDEPSSVTVQPDGNIVIAGSSILNGERTIYVTRLLKEGVFDNSFGFGGRVILNPTNGTDRGGQLKLTRDNKIIVAGRAESEAFVLRLLSNGEGDGSFAEGGILIDSRLSGQITLQNNSDVIGVTNLDPSGSIPGNEGLTAFRLVGGGLPTSSKLRDIIQDPQSAQNLGQDNRFNYGRIVAASDFYTVIASIDPPVNPAANPNGRGSVYIVDQNGIQTKLVNPSTVGNGEGFGISIDVNESIVAVGDSIARAVYLYDAGTGDLLRTILSPSTQPSDLFGFSVSLDQGRVFVGAPGTNNQATRVGRAYVFSTSNGTLERTVNNPSPAVDEAFGTDVAISANRLLVGAIGVGGNLKGEAYLFNRTSGALIQTLLPIESHSVTAFGNDVDLSSAYAVVGTRSGRAYAFDAVTGSLVSNLFNFNPPPKDQLGSLTQVAVAGNNVVLGAFHGMSEGVSAGRATVFDVRNGDVLWEVSSVNPFPGDAAGVVAITESSVFVGAPGTDTPPYNELDFEGSVMEYSLADGSLRNVYKEPRPTLGYFGSAISYGFQKYIVGAPGDLNELDQGAAYIYDAVDNVQTGKLVNPDPNEPGLFGTAVATNDKYAFVSDPLEDVGQVSGAGKVYRFDPVTGVLNGSYVSPNPIVAGLFGASLAVNDEVLVVGSPQSSVPDYLNSVHVFDLATGTVRWSFDDPTPTFGSGFADQIAISGDLLFVGGYDEDVVYAYNLRTGSLVNSFINPQPTLAGHFGNTLSAAGDFLVVGSATDLTFSSSGPTFVFNIRTGQLIRHLENPEANSNSAFGASVVTDGSIVAVSDTDFERVYIFDISSGDLLQTVDNNYAGFSQRFGSRLALAPAVPGTARIGAFAVDASNVLLASFGDVVFGSSAIASYYLVSNSIPRGISLTNASVNENGPPVSIIGYLDAFDPDASDTHSYSLVAGQGDTDNSKFVVTGNRLDLRESANFEVQSSYRVRIQVADQDGSFFQRYFTIDVHDRNDAPVLQATTTAFDSINEDQLSISGNSVEALLGGLFSDEDASTVAGIAIVGASGASSGRWQYTLSGNSGWTDFASYSESNALLLPSNSSLARVRFFPNRNFNGTVSLHYRAWDQTQGIGESTFNLTGGQKTGGSTAFSSTRRVSNLTINPINDAPILNIAGTPTFTSFNEDVTNPVGNTILSLVASRITDIDVGSAQGIAIVGVTGAAGGLWQYRLNSNTAWVNMGSPTASNALLLPVIGSESRIRFVPNANFNGTVSISYRAWDQTQGTIGSTINLTGTGATGGTTAFSTAVESATMVVARVNDAPVLDNSTLKTLTSINEDVTNPNGNTIVSLIASIVTDVDTAAQQGIAVVGVTGATNGKWQYTLNGGTTWLNLGMPTQAAARLLPSNGSLTKIRFVPNANFNGSVSVFYRAWDRTQGTVNGVFDLTGAGKVGGTSAFSTAIESATLVVNPVNDAPVLDNLGTPTLPAINEDATNPAGSAVASLIVSKITDVDAAALRGIAVVGITGGASGKWQYTLDGGVLWRDMGTPTETAARLLPNNGSQVKVRFLPNANFNGSATISYRAWDQTQGTAGGIFNLSGPGAVGGSKAFSTKVESAVQTVLAVNDAPVLDNSGSPILTSIKRNVANPPGNTVAAIVNPIVTDIDTGSQRGIAIVAVTGATQGVWQFTLNGGISWQNIVAPSESAAVLVPSNGSQAKIRFVPSANFIGTVRVNYRAWDQTQGTAGSVINLTGTNKVGGTTAFSSKVEASTLTVTV